MPALASGQFKPKFVGLQITCRRFDPVRRIFSDHDRRRVGVAGHQGRHDRRVDDPKPGQPMNVKARVNHGHGVGSHLTGLSPAAHSFGL